MPFVPIATALIAPQTFLGRGSFGIKLPFVTPSDKTQLDSFISKLACARHSSQLILRPEFNELDSRGRGWKVLLRGLTSPTSIVIFFFSNLKRCEDQKFWPARRGRKENSRLPARSERENGGRKKSHRPPQAAAAASSESTLSVDVSCHRLIDSGDRAGRQTGERVLCEMRFSRILPLLREFCDLFNDVIGKRNLPPLETHAHSKPGLKSEPTSGTHMKSTYRSLCHTFLVD